DFNNDGITDLLGSGALSGNTLTSAYVQLGNGDGTFQAPVSLAGRVFGIATGDLNGDGNLDVAAAYTPGVSVQLGNGDGTFRPPVTLTVPKLSVNGQTGTTWPQRLALGDLNRDGRLDVAVTTASLITSHQGWFGYIPNSYYTLDVYVGRGDGTFSAIPFRY